MGRGVPKCGKDDRGPHAKAIPRDQSHKSMFSHPRVVEDLVRGFVAELFEGGEEWVERLDFSTLGPLPTERIVSNLRSRSNDLVWRVRFRDAEDGPEWLHVVLMLEFQSSVDWGMALHVQGYAIRLFEGLWLGRRAVWGDRLPAVLEVVVYIGRVAWRAPQALADLIGKGMRRPVGAKPSRPKFAGGGIQARIARIPHCPGPGRNDGARSWAAGTPGMWKQCPGRLRQTVGNSAGNGFRPAGPYRGSVE